MNSNRIKSDPIRRTQINRGRLIALDASPRIPLGDEELGEFRVLEAAAARLGGRGRDGGEPDVCVDGECTACGILRVGRHGDGGGFWGMIYSWEVVDFGMCVGRLEWFLENEGMGQREHFKGV